jgi:methylmalonyl-CoA mutase cobalamin-binding subunit
LRSPLGFKPSIHFDGAEKACREWRIEALGEAGIAARALPPLSLNREAINQIDLDDVDAVCLCYLDAQPHSYAKYAGRRLKRRAPGLKIITWFLNVSAGSAAPDGRAKKTSGDISAFALDDAVQQVAGLLQRETPGEGKVAPVPADEAQRLAALRDLQLPAGGSCQFDEFAARVAAAFDMPIALISLIDEEHQRWPGAAGLPDDLDTCRMAARSTSICSHVVGKGDILVVKDVAKDPRFAKNPFLLENGIRFYAGAPLRTASGFVLGSLCVIDTKPRTFSDKECKLLQIIADDLMGKIELQCRQQGRECVPDGPAEGERLRPVD